MQVLSDACNTLRHSRVGNVDGDNRFSDERCSAPQFRPLVSRVGPGARILLLWLEKAAGRADVSASLSGSWTESVHRLRRRYGTTGDHLDRLRNRNGWQYSTGCQLHADGDVKSNLSEIDTHH